MNFEELRQDRLAWVEANRKNRFDVGIKRLLTGLYPDDAHFIYELLQNAEDAGASKVRFTLNSGGVEFEHNGDRLFSIADVDSITSIGHSTKKDDPTSIGKFGIGFKAVFAYTSTPEVESGDYHFRIHEMVVPDNKDLPPRTTTGEYGTRFFLPFDSPEKPADRAHAEIEKNIHQLNESSLLFLSNIKRIEYRLPLTLQGFLTWFLELKEIDENQIEISIGYLEDDIPDSIHYLRFERAVNVIDEKGKTETCRIAVAFRLNKTQKSKQSEIQITPQPWEIIPIEQDGASAGNVSIYFPAEKETSNLRFHLNAPFASTVARDSIRACAANDELRDHIADLIAEAMISIRNRNLLTTNFLATLPNDKDNLPPFYQPLQTRLVEEFDNKEITPMKKGGHAPAANVYRGGRGLSDLVNDRDLATILEKDPSSPLWVANPPLRNQREDDFLSLLTISEWDEKDLIDRLHCNPEIVQRWLSSKENEWHQGLYTLLYDFVQNAPIDRFRYRRSHYPESERKLKELRIVKCSDSIYRRGDECYFPSNDVENDKDFPRVIKAIYSSGTSKKQQEKARKFLEEIGVRDVGEAEQVEAILKQRYAEDTIKQRERNHGRDMRRFVELVEKDSSQAALFKDYCIFKVEHESGWEKPGMVFLDLPYCDTDLSAYYDENVILATPKRKLYQDYSSYHIEPERLGKFAEAVGAQTRLEVLKQEIPRGRPGGRGRHPEYRDLVVNAPGEKNSRHSINEDYNIGGFKSLLDHLSIKKAKLIWRTMQDLPVECLYARHRRSQSYEPRIGSSTLVHILKREEWVPQIKDGQSPPCKFVKPVHAVAGDLPPGFIVKAGSAWLSEIEFGKQAAEATQEHQNKKNVVLELGFPSLEDAENMAKMLEEDPTIIKEWKARKHKPQFPESPSSDRQRREEKISQQLEDAPPKEYKTKDRSVRTSSPSLDKTSYLRGQYTNANNEMACQICEHEMPFKKRNGEYYFEAVEAFSNDYFSKEHVAQYLALCPLCAAMYKEFIKHDASAMRELRDSLKNSDEHTFPLQLGEVETTIRFVETHFRDIETILKQLT